MSKINAEQMIKHHILLSLAETFKGKIGDKIKGYDLDDLWEFIEDDGLILTNDLDEGDSDYAYCDEDYLRDAKNDFRCSGTTSDIPCNNWSRNYESHSEATQLYNSVWVGWPYYYGGGKHGEPHTMEWLSEAYFVGYKEVVITTKEFYKLETINE